MRQDSITQKPSPGPCRPPVPSHHSACDVRHPAGLILRSTRLAHPPQGHQPTPRLPGRSSRADASTSSAISNPNPGAEPLAGFSSAPFPLISTALDSLSSLQSTPTAPAPTQLRSPLRSSSSAASEQCIHGPCRTRCGRCGRGSGRRPTRTSPRRASRGPSPHPPAPPASRPASRAHPRERRSPRQRLRWSPRPKRPTPPRVTRPRATLSNAAPRRPHTTCHKPQAIGQSRRRTLLCNLAFFWFVLPPASPPLCLRARCPAGPLASDSAHALSPLAPTSLAIAASRLGANRGPLAVLNRFGRAA
jgi:hypothetical protein